MALEIFGMRVDLELVVKNLRETKKQIQESIGKSPILAGGIAGGIAGAAAGLLAQIPGKLLNFMKEASPALKGTFDILKRSFSLMFKPFGDMIAVILRPMAMAVLKASVKWLSLFQDKEGGPRTPGEVAGGIGDVGDAVRNITIGMTDEAAREMLNALIEGSRQFGDIPQEVKEKFLGWLIKNKSAIEELPDHISNQMQLWIIENEDKFKSFTTGINEIFNAQILKPTKITARDFTDDMSSIFKGIASGTKQIGETWLADFKASLPSGGGGFTFGGGSASGNVGYTGGWDTDLSPEPEPILGGGVGLP